ncbi:MAG: UDP-N-acetylglucosamine 2-epimerase, partial [Lachnospiraceae bacterium]|nr:UDP-N-acetylglucosamine 2-epimerase [Lachnospiraceae bacterium]
TIVCEPVGYLMSVYLVNHSKKIVTDSGGLQREAFFAGKQCVTIFDYVVWPETMVGNRNQLAKAKKDDILKKLSSVQKITDNKAFGDGNAALKIVETISNYEK